MGNSDQNPTSEEQVQEQAGSLMLHALKHRKENIQELVDLLAAMDTAIAGLPKVVAVMEELGGSCRTPPRITDLGTPEEWKEKGTEEASRMALQSLQDIIDGHFSMLRTFCNSIRACAKSQAMFARYLKHVATMLLPYMVSDSFAADCSHAAMKMGKGDEALRAFAQAKFPSVFNKKPTDEH